MNNKPVIIEQTLDASVEKVWEALTNKDKMKEWYFNLNEFKPQVGFEFRFVGQGKKGENYMHLCKVTEVIPHKKLQYSWQYEDHNGYSLVTFELFKDENKTKLKLTHEGLETFPQNNTDFARESFNTGWTELITQSLPKYLEKSLHLAKKII